MIQKSHSSLITKKMPEWARRSQDRDLKDGTEVILRHGLVLPFKTASRATVHDDPYPLFKFCSYRFHKSPANRGPIAGMHVNVPAPKTTWAVIRIAVAVHHTSAIPANKIFFRTFKSTRHEKILPYVRSRTPNLPNLLKKLYHRDMPSTREKYIAELKRRGKESRVYRDYQLVGLEIADMLSDRSHKALYIKLAKEGNVQRLLAAAKDVAERKDIKNRGAYFMKVIAKP